jgi:homoaconitase/3-isopropylmalate dehydratase large subunit
MTPKTLYQKIWDAHVVREDPGQPSIIYIDSARKAAKSAAPISLSR